MSLVADLSKARVSESPPEISLKSLDFYQYDRGNLFMILGISAIDGWEAGNELRFPRKWMVSMRILTKEGHLGDLSYVELDLEKFRKVEGIFLRFENISSKAKD